MKNGCARVINAISTAVRLQNDSIAFAWSHHRVTNVFSNTYPVSASFLSTLAMLALSSIPLCGCPSNCSPTPEMAAPRDLALPSPVARW